MKNLLRIEELAMMILAAALFPWDAYAWWWFAALLLAPDIGIAGYLAGPRVGAVTYNLTHHKGIAIALLVPGAFVIHNPAVAMIGSIMLAHSSMDRVFGYGLKHFDAFNRTHLGTIGATHTS